METEGNYFAYCLDTNTKNNYFIVPSKYLKPRANARHSNPGVAWDTLGQEFWGGVFQSAWHESLVVDPDDGSFLDQTPKTDTDFEHLLTEAEYKESLVLATASSVQELQQYVGTCNIKVPKKFRRLDFSDASASQQHDESQQQNNQVRSSQSNQQSNNQGYSTSSEESASTTISKRGVSVQELPHHGKAGKGNVQNSKRSLDSVASSSQQYDEAKQQNEKKRFRSSECNQQSSNQDYSTASKSLEESASTTLSQSCVSVQELPHHGKAGNVNVQNRKRSLDSVASASQQHDVTKQQNEKRFRSSECNQQTKNEDFSTASKNLEEQNSTSKNFSTGATPFITPIVLEDPIESHDDSENEIDYSHIRPEGVANLGFFEYEIDGKVNRQNADNVCVLVIHYDFINDPLFRNGDASDVECLKTIFRENRNCNFRDILSPSKKTLLKLLSDQEKLLRFFNLQDEVPSVFMLFFLSHGTVNGKIWTSHVERETNEPVYFTTDEVFDSLQKLRRFDKCLKVVNFGSCRGSLYDSKFNSKNSLENYENKNSCRITSRPGMHNYVVFYSTVETTLANTDEKGSWFVRSICTSLNQANDEPLLDFFTIVQNRMHKTSCEFTTFDKNIPLGQTPELKMFTQDRKFVISKTTIAAKPFSNTDGSGNVSKISNEILSRQFSWKSNEGQDIRGRRGFILSLVQNKQVQEVKRALHKLDFEIRDWSLSKDFGKDFYFKMVSELEPDVGCILTCIFGPVCVNEHKEVCVRVQKGQEIPITDILHSFVGPKNDKLIGKPKILFVVNVKAPQTDDIPVPMKDLQVDATNHSGWLVLILKFEDALEKLIELLGNIGEKCLQELLGPLLTRESNIEEMVLLNSTLQYLLKFPTWPRTFVKPDFVLQNIKIPRGEMSRFKYSMEYTFWMEIDFDTLLKEVKQLFEENKNSIELQTMSHRNKTQTSIEVEPSIMSLPVKNSMARDWSDASYFWIFNSVAGAGKSTVLVEMAHQLAKVDEGLRLLLIPIKKYYRYLFDMPVNIVNEVEFLAKTTCNSHDDINNWIKKREVIVFLDGFDEVCPDFREKIIKILIALNNARVPLFIGTRPHELHHVQERIKNSTVVEIKPLDEAKQIEFLEKVAKKKKEEIEKLRTDFKDKDILENPLYLKLLAEYKGDGNLYDIFDKMVRNKVQICLKRENEGIDVGEGGMFEDSLKFIQLVASRYLTGVKIDQGSVTKEALEKINAFGVVTYCNERVNFTHQTFAEFLTAQKFIYDLKNPVAEEVPLFNDELVQCRKFVNLFFSMEKGEHASYTESFKIWAAKSTNRLNMVRQICGENLREVFKFLSPADFSLKDDNGKNALHFALRNLEMVKLVHQKNSELATETTNTGESCLHLAIDDYKCSEEVALWILQNTEVGKNAETKLNYTTLLRACQREKWEVAAQLVTKHNIEINDPNKSREKSILQYAVQSNNTDLVQGLLDRGSNVNLKDCFGVTALHLAAGSNGNSEIVKILLEKGAKVNAQDKDKRTALHYAAKHHEDTVVVQKLLEYGVDVNLQDEEGFTALHLAAKSNGNPEIVNILLENGARVNLEDNRKRNALHYAASSNDAGVVQKLLEYGADVNSQDEEGFTALHLAARSYLNPEILKHMLTKGAKVHLQNKKKRTALHYAAKHHEDTEVVQKLLEYCIDVNLQDEEGFTALHLAAKSNGNPEIVNILLENGAKVNLEDNRKRNALHYAASSNDAGVVQKLLEYGADVHSQDEEGIAALHLAARSNENPEILDILLENGAEVNLQNNEKQTALHYAFENLEDMDDTEVIQKLLEYGADVNSQDKKGFTALHLAARSYLNPEILKHMLTKGAKVHLQNKKKRTALHYAAKHHEDTEVVQKLLEYCIDVNLQDEEGFTALHLAARSNRNPQIVKILIENGAKVHLTDNNKQTALHQAFKNNKVTEVVHKLLEYGADVNSQDEEGYSALHLAARSKENPENVKLLLEKGAKVHLESIKKRTALHYAAENHEVIDDLQKLLEYGVDVNLQDEEGFTALHLAARSNRNPQIVKILIEKGAKVNLTDNKKRTALHHAFKNNKVTEVVQKLIENGADVNSQDEEGFTALHLAVRSKENPEIVKILLEKGAEVNLTDNKKRSVLHHAFEHLGLMVDTEGIQKLLEYGVDVDLQDEEGFTALHLAARSNKNPEVVKILLEKGAQVHLTDNKKRTALHHAFKNSEVTEVVQKLLEYGADVNSQDEEGFTALHLAAWSNGNPEFVKILLEKSAKINELDNDKWTPLHFAAKFNQVPEITQMLLENGAEIHSRCQQGSTALHQAAGWNKNPEIVKILLDKGAKINAVGNTKWTPLHLAARFNPASDIVQMLLENGADVHLQSQGEITALHLAAGSSENPEIVESLLQKGAEINVENALGETALFLAAKHNRVKEVVQKLLDHGAKVNEMIRNDKECVGVLRKMKVNSEVLRILNENDSDV